MKIVSLLFIALIFFSFTGEHPKNDLAKNNLKGKIKEIIDSGFTIFDTTFQSDERNIKFQKKEWKNILVSKYDIEGNFIELDFYSEQGDTGISRRSIKYNKSGLILETSSNGTHHAESAVCLFKYDLNDNLTEKTIHSITDSETVYCFYTYDYSGNMIQMKRKILNDTTKVEDYYYKYDSNNNMIEVISYWLDSPKDIDKSTYKYDDKGNEIEVSYHSNGSATLTPRRSYKYAAFDKLGNWIVRGEYNQDIFQEGELHIRKIKYY